MPGLAFQLPPPATQREWRGWIATGNEAAPLATNPMRITADDLLDIEVPSHLRRYELANGRAVSCTWCPIS